MPRFNKKQNNQSKFTANPAMLPQVFSRRVRKCPLSGENAPILDYKNVVELKKFTSERGKILPSRITAVSAKKQRKLAKEIKKARALALLPYVNN